jgi:preprotein translocase subunit SecG
METLVLIVHVLLAVALIALILLQQGKGAEAGASFGSGSSQTVFGSQGTSGFLGKVTAGIATAIFVTSFMLAVYSKQKAESIGDQGVPAPVLIESSVDVEPPVLEEAPSLEELIQTPVDSDVPPIE